MYLLNIFSKDQELSIVYNRSQQEKDNFDKSEKK